MFPIDDFELYVASYVSRIVHRLLHLDIFLYHLVTGIEFW